MPTWRPHTTSVLSPEPHKYRYAIPGAAARLAWAEADLPDHLFEVRRKAVEALLDDAVALFTRVGRPAERITDQAGKETAWIFARNADTRIAVRCSASGALRFARFEGENAEPFTVAHGIRYDASRGMLVGAPLVGPGGDLVRDLTTVGYPVLFSSPLEDLVLILLDARQSGGGARLGPA